MVKKIIIAFILCLTSLFVYAQEESTPLRHEIGMNTQFLLPGIFNSGAAPLDLMYKSIHASDAAIRLGLNFGVNSRSSFNNDNPEEINKTFSFNLGISFGKEWLQHLNQYWTFYYGGDVMPLIYTNSTKTINAGEVEREKGEKSLGAEIRPFLGIRFNINDRLYVASEASFFLEFMHGNAYNHLYGENPDTKSESFTLFNSGLRPLNGIYLFYRF